MIETQDLELKREMQISSGFHIESYFPIKLSHKEDMNSKDEKNLKVL
jgi:hypothetical protein